MRKGKKEQERQIAVASQAISDRSERINRISVIYTWYQTEPELQGIQHPVLDLPGSMLRPKTIGFVPGEGSVRPLAVFVGEAPGKTENNSGRPFVGVSGRILDRALAARGIERSSCWITNIVKFMPLDERGRIRPPDGLEIEVSSAYLRKELGVLASGGPRMPDRASPLLVPLGRSALTALTGNNFRRSTVSDVSGMMFATGISGTQWDMVPNYHPSALRSRETRQVWETSMDRVASYICDRTYTGYYRDYK